MFRLEVADFFWGPWATFPMHKPSAMRQRTTWFKSSSSQRTLGIWPTESATETCLDIYIYVYIYIYIYKYIYIFIYKYIFFDYLDVFWGTSCHNHVFVVRCSKLPVKMITCVFLYWYVWFQQVARKCTMNRGPGPSRDEIVQCWGDWGSPMLL